MAKKRKPNQNINNITGEQKTTKQIDIDTGKHFIMNYGELETRVAFVNSGKLEEYHIERINEKAAMTGAIYLGRINRNDTSLQASFVDIGTQRNAFLHHRDIIPDENKVDKIELNQSKPQNTSFISKVKTLLSRDKRPRLLKLFEHRRTKCLTTADVPKFFRPGSEILVQVTKGPIGTKGARLTAAVSIPGRYLVLVPNSTTVGLSKKIESNKERTRLKKILINLNLPSGMGLICRTVGEGVKEVYFQRDLDMLLEKWEQIESSFSNPQIPAKVYTEPNLFEKTMRELVTVDIDNIILDDKPSYDNLMESLYKIAGDSVLNKIHYYDKAKSIFDYYSLKNQIDHIFSRVAKLPSGGYICLDETEALIAIDVNSGRNKGKNLLDTILTTNKEAAAEVARQLKLRDIGGIIVIDFIDMSRACDRDEIYKLMNSLVREDKARTKIAQISRFGIMEMTRQRVHESIQDLVYDKCPYCHGRGQIKSVLSMSVEIQRKLKEILRRRQNVKTNFKVRIIMHPEVLERLKKHDSDLFTSLESEFGGDLSFRADEKIHHESFQIVNPENNNIY